MVIRIVSALKLPKLPCHILNVIGVMECLQGAQGVWRGGGGT